MPVVLLRLNHWWIGDGVVRNRSWDRRLFHRKVLLDRTPTHETSHVSPWSGMQNRRNCSSITPTCTDTSYRVYLMNIEKSFRFLLSLSLSLLHASSSDARLINVELWNDGTLFNALWMYATYDTREMISSIERAAYPTRTCVYTQLRSIDHDWNNVSNALSVFFNLLTLLMLKKGYVHYIIDN